MSKYEPLVSYLQSTGQDEVRLSFEQIESILGFPLPKSARQHSAWWANSQTADSHTWAHLWLKAGYSSRGLSLTGEWVTFQRLAFYEPDSVEAREGYEVDRNVFVRIRNPKIVEERKIKDNNTCQACGFCLCIGSRWVIEVHHLNPLAVSGETITKLDDVVCLCPTCHRIAHLRSQPFSVSEIETILASGA